MRPNYCTAGKNGVNTGRSRRDTLSPTPTRHVSRDLSKSCWANLKHSYLGEPRFCYLITNELMTQ